METKDFARRLDTALQEAPPLPPLESHVAAGRRALRRRRVLSAAGGAMAVVGLLGTTFAVANITDGERGVPPASALQLNQQDIVAQRDRAVAGAYGWMDLELDHDFRETPLGLRYTISDAVKTEALDRLLELNHARYAEEAGKGLHNGKRSRPKKSSPKTSLEDAALFDDD